jgi:hypothetical protein
VIRLIEALHVLIGSAVIAMQKLGKTVIGRLDVGLAGARL